MAEVAKFYFSNEKLDSILNINLTHSSLNLD